MRSAFFFCAGSLALLLAASCAVLPTAGGKIRRTMDPGRDTFAFANETVWNYREGRVVGRTDRPETERTGERYTRRCFVMARSAVQFWKFARFEPGAPTVDRAELVRRVRGISAIPVWHPARPPAERIVLPGFESLHDFSRREPVLLQENIGAGWPTYFRPGNFGIVTPPSRSAQERTAAEIDALLAGGEPPLLWLANFPSLSINHAVVVWRRTADKRGVRYHVYDPNLPGQGMTLGYDPATRTFSYPPTFYFTGGSVDVRVVYRGILR